MPVDVQWICSLLAGMGRDSASSNDLAAKYLGSVILIDDSNPHS